MKMTRTVPALAGLLILAGLVGCKKEDCTTTIVQANQVDTTGLVVKLLFQATLLIAHLLTILHKYISAIQPKTDLEGKTMLLFLMVAIVICKSPTQILPI